MRRRDHLPPLWPHKTLLQTNSHSRQQAQKCDFGPPQTLVQEPRGLPRDLQKGGILSCAVFTAAGVFFVFLHIYAVNDCSMKFNVQVYFVMTVSEVCCRSFFCLSWTEGKSSHAAMFVIFYNLFLFPLKLCQTKWILISLLSKEINSLR